MFKKLIASIVIIPFLIVPLFCCCLSTVQAATIGSEHCQKSSDGHTSSHDHADKKSSDTCDCHSLGIAADSNVSAQVIISNFNGHFVAMDDLTPRSYRVSNRSMRLAYLGPPAGFAAIPFYTLYHSLRI